MRRAAATFAASLVFEKVERRYGDHIALQDLNLAVNPGEVVCLLGPSGSGKTTLLRIGAGIEKPSSGRVLINDLEVAGPSRFVQPEKRSVGLMFQDFALFPHLTVLQNVSFGLRFLPREEAQKEALSMLARVDLSELSHYYPHMLSGGQQQRVALARVIVPRPSVVLMDEPFSGLDVQLRDAIQEETLALLRETRATSIIVTHHPEEAMRLADRIAVMREGHIIQIGRTEDLYLHPKELFIARLFSEINEISYRVKGGQISTPVGRLPAPGARDGENVIWCIRERGIQVMELGHGLPGRILHTKFLGDFTLLEVGVQGFELPLRIRANKANAWEKRKEIGVDIDPSKTLVFSERGEILSEHVASDFIY
ncbi:MAG: ABC transporter ATP-binding protein [Hyphomicrobium sp.]